MKIKAEDEAELCEGHYGDEVFKREEGLVDGTSSDGLSGPNSKQLLVCLTKHRGLRWTKTRTTLP